MNYLLFIIIIILIFLVAILVIRYYSVSLASPVKIGSGDHLYHGSKHKFDQLLPQPSKLLNGEKVVFATPSREFALAFINYPSGNDIELGSFENKLYLVEMVPGALEVMDSPGYLYTVENQSFHSDKRVGMPQYEVVSNKQVKIVESKYIPSALKELYISRIYGNLKIIRNNKVFKIQLAKKYWDKVAKKDTYSISLPYNDHLRGIDTNSVLIFINSTSQRMVTFVKEISKNNKKINLKLKIWFIE